MDTGVRVWINHEDSDTKPARWVGQDSGPLYFWTLVERGPHPLPADLLFLFFLSFFLSRAQLFTLNFPGKYVHAHLYPFSRFEGRKYSCTPSRSKNEKVVFSGEWRNIQFSTGLLLHRETRLFALNLYLRRRGRWWIIPTIIPVEIIQIERRLIHFTTIALYVAI